jgi:hypothetical protein
LLQAVLLVTGKLLAVFFSLFWRTCKMDDEDLFGVFNKTKTETVRQQQVAATPFGGPCYAPLPAPLSPDWLSGS